MYHAWTDFFEVRAPVALSADVLRTIQADTLRSRWGRIASRWRLAEHIGPRVSSAALRAGRLDRPFEPGVESATFGAISRYTRELGASLLEKPGELAEVPYWVSLDYFQVAAVGGGRTYVASNLFYPIRIHDGQGRLRDSLSVPPRSWRPVRRPRRGEFTNDRRGDSTFLAFLQTFTMITDMAVVADSVLIVNHGAYRLERDDVLRIQPTHSDIYVKGERVATDLASPGTLLAYSPSSLFFLASGAPDGGWAVIEYVWRHER